MEKYIRPLDPFAEMINNIFSPIFTSSMQMGISMPAIEMEDTENEIIIKAMIPGVSKENVDVIVDDDRIILKGEYKQEKKEEKSNIVYSEISYGRFERVIPLPEGIDPEKAKAKFDNGMLIITLPKTSKKLGRKLEIE